jgi:hypothetical protein
MRSGDTLFGSGRAADSALAGMIVAPFDLGPMARYTVDASSGQVVAGRTRLAVDPRMWATTLWTRDERAPRDTMGTAWWAALGFIPDLLPQRIADAYLDRSLRIVPVGELPKQATPGQLFRFDHDAGTIGESFAMPIGTLPMSPTFVPRKNGGRDEGYLVTLTCGPEADEVWIFDASSLAAGPLCRLGHPRFNIGFSLHTTWMGDLRPSAGSGYRVSPTDDYGERVTKLSSDAQALAKQVLGI